MLGHVVASLLLKKILYINFPGFIPGLQEKYTLPTEAVSRSESKIKLSYAQSQRLSLEQSIAINDDNIGLCGSVYTAVDCFSYC